MLRLPLLAKHAMQSNQRRLMSSAASGAVYMVVGANGGIGSHLCSRLLRGNPEARVAVACRNQDAMTELVNTLAAEANAKDRILAVQMDATKPDQVEAGVQSVIDAYGRIDGVANCVGSIVLKSAHATSEAEFSETLLTNLHSSFSILRCAVKPMMKQKEGSMVFCSSAVASIGLQNHEAIAAAKAGIIGLAKSAASTYAKYNIRINTVSPGLTDTKIASKITSNPAILKASVAMHPLGRIAQPDEVAAAIEFLLTQKYVTGQVLGVDGGLGSLK